MMQSFDSISADRTGLEPATSAVTGRHSNQLNYRSFKQVCTEVQTRFWDGKDKGFGISHNKSFLISLHGFL